MNDAVKIFLTEHQIACIGDIKWAHAVNSIKYLERVINNPSVDFLEVDVSLSNNLQPIAAHYENESDITIEYLLNYIKYSNKGLKLDFKDKGAVEPCLVLLKSAELKQPVILNADILSVKGAPAADFVPESFIQDCLQEYPKGLMSLGWRTNIDSTYQAVDISNILAACQKLPAVTFPVRVSALVRSWGNVQKLLQKDGYSLSLWNSEPLNQELKEWVKERTNKNRCFYDFE
jgi:hypothetical protein